jgi:hypothetical protein
VAAQRVGVESVLRPLELFGDQPDRCRAGAVQRRPVAPQEHRLIVQLTGHHRARQGQCLVGISANLYLLYPQRAVLGHRSHQAEAKASTLALVHHINAAFQQSVEQRRRRVYPAPGQHHLLQHVQRHSFRGFLPLPLDEQLLTGLAQSCALRVHDQSHG